MGSSPPVKMDASKIVDLLLSEGLQPSDNFFDGHFNDIMLPLIWFENLKKKFDECRKLGYDPYSIVHECIMLHDILSNTHDSKYNTEINHIITSLFVNCIIKEDAECELTKQIHIISKVRSEKEKCTKHPITK